MALQYTATHRTNAMTDINTALGSTGYLLIYTGSPPANVATADGGTLLASLPLNATPGAVATGVLTLNGTATATAASVSNPITAAAAATGTAGHFRLCTSSAGTTCIVQGTVGTSGADLNLSSVSLSSGVTVNITNATITAFGA